jgi:hypothetical protein
VKTRGTHSWGLPVLRRGVLHGRASLPEAQDGSFLSTNLGVNRPRINQHHRHLVVGVSSNSLYLAVFGAKTPGR